MSDKPAFIHHVNFPTTDPERTIEWYTKVFGMKYIKPKSNTKVVLMTRGNFDLHFTPVEEMDRRLTTSRWRWRTGTGSSSTWPSWASGTRGSSPGRRTTRSSATSTTRTTR